MKKNKKAFTLAEMIAVVVILGITAAIVVPPLVRKQIEAAERTKLKEIIRVYDFYMNKITVEHDLKSNNAVQEWADDDCHNTSAYFKATKFLKNKDGKNNFCIFRTPNGVWMDISNILNPKVSFDENFNDPNKTFDLVSLFDENGSLRVDDLSKPGDYYDELVKLYDFIKGEKSPTDMIKSPSKAEGTKADQCIKDNADTCDIGGDQYTKITFTDPNYTFTNGSKKGETSEMLCSGDCFIKDYGKDSDLLKKMSDEDKAKYMEKYTDENGNFNYWAFANNFCSEKGSHLATVAEIKAAKSSKGVKKTYSYWANEDSSESLGYIDSNNSSVNTTNKNLSSNRILCVGDVTK